MCVLLLSESLRWLSNASNKIRMSKGCYQNNSPVKFPLWLSGKESDVSMRTQVRSLASLSGLRICCCLELQCRSQTGLGSGIAVAVVWAAATAPIPPLAWKPPCAVDAALKRQKQKKPRMITVGTSLPPQVHLPTPCSPQPLSSLRKHYSSLTRSCVPWNALVHLCMV